MASYERNIRIEGENSSSSLVDKILEVANENKINDLNEFHTSLAFWTDLIDLANKDFFPNGSKILYAHLGGAPALNGYSYTYRNG